MPKGVYARKKDVSVPVVPANGADAAQKAAEVANQQAAQAIMAKVETLGK